ncbi:CRISPR-associated protein Cmr1 [Methylomagnum ishizawai]|uniref:CRISPR-associated protein Cmr1 n=1 Tax=Methylomagnum ishizawai TaxID=1760988 RepID=A0A1Y6CX39_9GAMM|nr:type III-B CRISPR module RAMP protein Cmr1 [Methylomagnum ishizawai]SMF95239.1 CRISPR-associated protein Cmr1 [Methylomagnum ishizawai]
MFEVKKKTIEAEFELVTPAFIGGADQDRAELRPPSIKGALRFWWRALRWGEFYRNSERNEAQALRELHQTEAALFGAAMDSEQNHGQGLFLIKVTQRPKSLKFTENENISPGYQYLLGMGLFQKEGIRRGVVLGNFYVHLLFKKGSDKYQMEIADSLCALGMFGGLGSRSRRGIGSVNLRKLAINGELQPQMVPADEDGYMKQVERLFGKAYGESPPFTAFSPESRVDISIHAGSYKGCARSWQDALSRIGDDFQLYRSYRIEKAKRNFEDDHNLVLKVANLNKVYRAPRRMVFGLPHNYFYSSVNANVELNPVHSKKNHIMVLTKEGRSRRSSPFFIHIHKFGAGKFCAVQMVIPACFLPAGDRLEYSVKKRAVCNVTPTPDWKCITDYLDRFGTPWRFPK